MPISVPTRSSSRSGRRRAPDGAPRRADGRQDSHERTGESRIRTAVVRLLAGSGTGPIKVTGRVEGGSEAPDCRHEPQEGTRTEQRQLAEPPMLSLNLARRLADAGLVPGTRHRWNVFDPATLSSAPSRSRSDPREIIWTANTPIPAFRVDMAFVGLRTTSWITDTARSSAKRARWASSSVKRDLWNAARALAVPGQMGQDLLPGRGHRARIMVKQRIDDPTATFAASAFGWMARTSHRSTFRAPDKRVDGNIVEITDPQLLVAGPADPDVNRYLQPELFIESDAAGNRAEAQNRRRECHRHPGARGGADALRQFHPAEEADRRPPVRARSAADQDRRLQRAHGAVCRDVARGRHPGAHCGGAGVRAWSNW